MKRAAILFSKLKPLPPVFPTGAFFFTSDVGFFELAIFNGQMGCEVEVVAAFVVKDRNTYTNYRVAFALARAPDNTTVRPQNTGMW